MRAVLSVIIPTLNAEKHLPACLLALMEGLEAGLVRELVISDGGSEDATLRIADEVGAVVIEGAPSRGGQLRRGALAAQGDWLLVLHADTVLDPGWSDCAQDHILHNWEKAGYFRLRFDAAGIAPRLVAGWANLRARLFGLPYGDQALLIPRAFYRQLGGFRSLALMEDVDLVRRIGRRRLTMLDAVAVTSAERYRHGGFWRRPVRNQFCLLLWFLGMPAERIMRLYYR